MEAVKQHSGQRNKRLEIGETGLRFEPKHGAAQRRTVLGRRATCGGENVPKAACNLTSVPSDEIIRYPEKMPTTGETRLRCEPRSSELQQQPPPCLFRGGTSSSQAAGAHSPSPSRSLPRPCGRKRNFTTSELAGSGGWESLADMEKRFRSAARTFLGGFLKDSARIIKPSQGI